MWQWLYNPGSGIQFMVNSWGWTDFQFALTTDRKNAIWAIIITGIWDSAGFSMALFLAGLRSVDPDIIKAAQIDGASWFRTYRKVILPTIAPIFLAVAVVLLQFAIKTFDLAVALTNSGPGISTTFPATYVYDFMFQRGEIGGGRGGGDDDPRGARRGAGALLALPRVAEAPGGGPWLKQFSPASPRIARPQSQAGGGSSRGS